MARPNQATKAKRDRERRLQERQQEKREKRAQRTELKKERDRSLPDETDPGVVADQSLGESCRALHVSNVN